MTRYLVIDRSDAHDDPDCVSGARVLASCPQEAAETYASRDGDNHGPEACWALEVIDTVTGERFAFHVKTEVYYRFRCSERLLEVPEVLP